MIPIITRPSDWEWAPISRLQALPKDAKPITRWDDEDEAWLDVVKGVRKAVNEVADKTSRNESGDKVIDLLEQLQSVPSNSSWKVPHDTHSREEAFRSPATDPRGPSTEGTKDEKRELRDSDAPPNSNQVLMPPEAYDGVISNAFDGKGNALYRKGQYEKALEAFADAVDHNPYNSTACYHKGLTLAHLERHDEAMEAFGEAYLRRREYPQTWRQTRSARP